MFLRVDTGIITAVETRGVPQRARNENQEFPYITSLYIPFEIIRFRRYTRDDRDAVKSKCRNGST